MSGIRSEEAYYGRHIVKAEIATCTQCGHSFKSNQFKRSSRSHICPKCKAASLVYQDVDS